MQKIRLVIADDNAALRETLRHDFAEYQDMEIVGEAGNGLEALEILGKTEADVLLLDIIMPRMDGLRVLAGLSDSGSTVSVLVYTAVGSDEIIARAMELGAAYYMVKPIGAELLHRRILEVAQLKKGTAEALEDKPSPAAYSGWSAEERVANLFLSLGIPPHVKGYSYLREAVKMVMNDRDVINRITKELYPGIARRFDTSSSKVERAMRHAIEVAWNRGRMETTNQMLGVNLFSEREKPTNGEFIALIADKASGE